LVKISRIAMIESRVKRLRQKVKVDTEKLREKLLFQLEEIFNNAAKLAKNEKAEIKERQMWARIAAYTAQTMESIARGLDERTIDEQLKELERLVNEAKAKAKTRKSKSGNATAYTV